MWSKVRACLSEQLIATCWDCKSTGGFTSTKIKQKKSCRYLDLNIHNWEKRLCMQKQNLKPNSKRHFDFVVPGDGINCSPPAASEDLHLQRAKAAWSTRTWNCKGLGVPAPFSATSATTDRCSGPNQPCPSWAASQSSRDPQGCARCLLLNLGVRDTLWKTNIILLNLSRFHYCWHCNNGIRWQTNSHTRGIDEAPKTDLCLPSIL